MPNRAMWDASIDLGQPVRSDGLQIVQGIGKEVSRPPRRWAEGTPLPSVNDLWPDATVVPTTIGGSSCHRTAPVEKPREEMGWWRGALETLEGTADALCIRVKNPPKKLAEVYVTFEFYETEPGWIAVHYSPQDQDGFVHHVSTWEHGGAWDHTWINTAGSNTWQKGIIRLVRPQFAGKGPFGADFRFVSSGPLYVRRVTLSTERPADFDQHDLLAHARRIDKLLRPRFPKAHAPVSVGNIGGIFEHHDVWNAHDVTPWLPVYRAMGITAIQSYVRWSSIERTEGVWDWSEYDWVVKQAKLFGLKWIAFIMIGPWYAMPKWWLDSPSNYRNKCLEHNEESWVQSVWNPVTLRYVERFFAQFAAHYREQDIESVFLGPSGDYGETTTNGTFLGRNYHTHEGYWCGEDIAVADFRRAMKAKYRSVKKLNATWGMNVASFDELRPLLRADAPSDRMWVDQVAWYVDRMTWWTERWAKIVRKALPNTVIYMACGGPGDPPHAGHWANQMQATKRTGIGARVTNEGGDYGHNFAYTSWLGTCCRFYDLPFGNEPWGGDMCGVADLGRIYNALLQNAANYWFYDSQIRPRAGQRALELGLSFLTGSLRRTNRVAVYYPWTYFVVKNEYGFSKEGARDRFWPQVEELRDIIDFDLVDDTLVRDGIMREYDFLIVLQGTVYERAELERLVVWVESGGVLITHNIGIPTTVEGDTALGQKLLAFDGAYRALERELGGRLASVGKGRTIMFPHSADRRGWHGDERWERDYIDHPATHPDFWTMITNVLAHASDLGTGLPDYPVVDGEQDGVFGALVERDGKPGVLYFSQVAKDVVKHVRIPGKQAVQVTVPAGRITFVPVRP